MALFYGICRAISIETLVALLFVLRVPQVRAEQCTPEAARAAVMHADPQMTNLACSVDTICHDFTHEGGDMIAVLSCGSGAVMYWYLFKKGLGGRWQLRWTAPDKDESYVLRHGTLELVPKSDDLIVSGPVYNSSDPNCCPSGGMAFSRLRWDGHMFRIIKRWKTPPRNKP